MPNPPANLAELFPKASASFLKLNQPSHAQQPATSNPPVPAIDAQGVLPPHPGSAPKPKRRARARPLAESEAKTNDPRFYLVRVTSVRSRLIDTDNLVPKWHIDALRYAGILPSDAPDKARIETSQRKAKDGEAPHTQIQVIEITP